MIKGKNKSNFVTQMSSVKQRVIAYLQANPDLRDNDQRLVANYWHYEVLTRIKKEPKSLNGEELLGIYATNQLTAADVITRARRKAQEEMPELRGQKWEERQGLSTEVRNQVSQPERTIKGRFKDS